MKKAQSSLLIIILFLSSYPYVINSHAWLSGWQYRKSHDINSASGAGTNYQIKITVYYGSGSDSGENVYLNSHCKTDFGDIRFTDNDGETLLDYWMQSKVDSNNAVFWVEVKDDLSSSSTAIYIYYGKADATTTSNGNDVFPVFVDVEEGNINDWSGTSGTGYSFAASTTQKHTGSYGSRITLNPSGAGGYFYKTVTSYSNYNYAFRGWIYDDGDSQASNELSFRFTNTGTGLLIIARSNDRSASYYAYLDGTWKVSSVARSNGWHCFEFRVISGHVYLDIDGTQIADVTSVSMQYPSEIRHFGYRKPTYNYGDDYLVRKYVSPEPTHGAWGSEELAFYIQNISCLAVPDDPDDGEWFSITVTVDCYLLSNFIRTRIDLDYSNLNISFQYSNITGLWTEEHDPNNYVSLDDGNCEKTILDEDTFELLFYIQISASVTKEGAYDVQVVSIADFGNDTEIFSSVFSLTIRTPEAPSLLFGSANTSMTYLGWTDNSEIETTFEIQRSLNGIDYSFLANSAATQYNDTAVSSATYYYYKVRACRNTGVGYKNSSFTSSDLEYTIQQIGGAEGSEEIIIVSRYLFFAGAGGALVIALGGLYWLLKKNRIQGALR